MMEDTQDAVVFEDVWKIYRMGKIEYPALRGLTLRIKNGEFAAVMGPSGSGKSTFLHIAGTLDKPSKGRVMLKGIDVSRLSDSKLSEFRNRVVGFVFQTFNLVPRLSALENVELPLVARGVPKRQREAMAERALRIVGLGDKLHNRPGELSGGEQQRVAIARAIVGEPEIILADEPTGNLDSGNSEIIVELLREINKRLGTTIIIVTHNVEVANAADRIIKIRDGRVESVEVVANA